MIAHESIVKRDRWAEETIECVCYRPRTEREYLPRFIRAHSADCEYVCNIRSGIIGDRPRT